jgi:hypothetical protein
MTLGVLNLGDLGVTCTTTNCMSSYAGCTPQSVMGPLQPGQYYCPTPVLTPNVNVNGQVVSTAPGSSLALPTSCPLGSTCTIIAGVPNTAVYTLGAILGLFIVMGVAGK